MYLLLFMLSLVMGWLSLMVHEQLDGKPFIFFDKIDPFFPGPLAI